MGNNVCDLSDNCSGCGACKVICPVKAISVNMNDEGFFCADVNEKLCIECGKCKSVCLKNGIVSAIRLQDGKMFSAQSIDEDVIKSCSSGGIAYELTKYAISEGRVVCGVVYDNEKNIARTKLAKTLDEAENFKGSKYLQSDSSDAFCQLVQEAKTDLNRKFLVFGTPCQIYGLSSLLELNNIRERCILVDLFCHGVPSYLVWNSYLEKITKKSGKIKHVSFREKSIGWHNFVMHIIGEKSEYREPSDGDLYYHAFFDNVLFSKACYNCEVRREYSKADIRLGDYWGKRYQHREDGVSAVLALTQSGLDFLNKIENIKWIDTTSVEEVLLAQSVHVYNTEALRQTAIEELKSTGDLKKTIYHYRKKFSFTKRTKLFLKELLAILPDSIRTKIRYLYKKI